MEQNDIEDILRGLSKTRDIKNPTGPLAHNFTTYISTIGTLLNEEIRSHNFMFSVEQCQTMLKTGILKLREIVQRIETKTEELENPEDKLNSTDKINPETLNSFIQFLNSFIGENRKLTLEEFQAIQKKFDEMFPDVIPKRQMKQGFQQE